MTKFSFVFPGQGSQEPGMGKFLFENFSVAREVFEEASDSINLDIKKLCFEGPAETLALTENTQPAIVTVSVALKRVLEKELNLLPEVVAGHSVGEYAALVANQTISFPNAVKAVKLRGQAMQSAVPVGMGGMAAVMGLADEQVEILCQYTEKISSQKPISPANFNCPGQVVISGNKKAIDWISQNAKPEEVFKGAAEIPKRMKIIPLNVSAPFHCAMMKPAEEVMSHFLASVEFKKPLVPVIQNTTAKSEEDEKQIRKNIIEQICAPVRWTQSIQYLQQNFSNTLIECGHGKVLTGLIKKINPELKVHGIASLEDFKNLESLLNSPKA